MYNSKSVITFPDDQSLMMAFDKEFLYLKIVETTKEVELVV